MSIYHTDKKWILLIDERQRYKHVNWCATLSALALVRLAGAAVEKHGESSYNCDNYVQLTSRRSCSCYCHSWLERWESEWSIMNKADSQHFNNSVGPKDTHSGHCDGEKNQVGTISKWVKLGGLGKIRSFGCPFIPGQACLPLLYHYLPWAVIMIIQIDP